MENTENKDNLLATINNPNDLKKLNRQELPLLSQEIRDKIIQTISQNGGHLASSLGAVDLAIAVHYVFNSPSDKLLWDVGHQAYAHKILTERKETFCSIRTFNGISGFPKISESAYDSFGSGHASTSISAALGFSCARDLKNENYNVVAIIGDGSMTGGLAFEGLQNAGYLKKKMLVILNDNEMFISQKVGAVSDYFAKIVTAEKVQKTENKIMEVINKFHSLSAPFEKFIRRAKTMFSPGMLFEEMGFAYIGPIQGHNINNLILILDKVKNMKGPVLLHIITKKGKGYEPAEKDPVKYHGIGKFDIETGKSFSVKNTSYTQIFSEVLIKLAQKNEKIVAVTAAMSEGTGLSSFAKTFPDRYFDTGIAESHAVTFCAGLAASGMLPVCAIYSTFMQRAIDNVIHDVCLQNLPVIFILDRAGLVGEDGGTHHGVFDLSYLKYIPNLIIMSPCDENELQDMLKTAFSVKKPCAIRYPRGAVTGVDLSRDYNILETGKAQVLKEALDICFLAIGNQVATCLKAAEILEKQTIKAGVVNMRFLKPLDENLLKELALKIKNFITVEENVIIGGLGESVKSCLCNSGVNVECIGIADEFIEHGDVNILREICGLTAENTAKKAFELLKKQITAF
ncbi:MAG: 1-deoxy-D-xylulose-5-phosphate synthase [Elusimicrobiota bacterium]|jgi:1-deoxy-D-xylulose-5-phosphate synthase|nr:1-deoxy-D-xylulose-5-phosphate synthase [Elusimicrobiota bacterium]